MNTLPIFIPAKRRAHRKPRLATPQAPAPVALTLVSAVYDFGPRTLTLQFDRAINFFGFDGEQLTVADGVNVLHAFNAAGVITIINPATIEVHLILTGPYSEPEIVMNASATTGIVAVDDGGTWDGVTDLHLPFP